jgi:hypothetical protein
VRARSSTRRVAIECGGPLIHQTNLPRSSA